MILLTACAVLVLGSQLTFANK